ncbi:MAG: hypothetical protein FWD98_02515 [Defluviitaleaceae bacterium]|nr:hypothetical protein [Defluviitaleaceae bacterium]
MQGLIVKDDRRYDYTEAYLEARGIRFRGERGGPGRLDFAILPFAQDVDEEVYGATFFSGLRQGAPVFSGVRKAYIADMCRLHMLEYHPMMDDTGVALENAVPTSEGVIAYLVQNTDVTLAGSRVLVAGYGICGADLSRRLKVLGADVYALVRTQGKADEAEQDGVLPLYLREATEQSFDAVVNTIPAQVFTEEKLASFGGALFVDIASKPYGFDMEAAKRLNNRSALLPGLPGKCAVRTAGEILGKYVYEVLRGKRL